MKNENSPQGQAETAAASVENQLTHPDLLQLEWVLDDRIAEWEWRDDGLDELIEKGRATLERIRAMIRLDEEGGEN